MTDEASGFTSRDRAAEAHIGRDLAAEPRADDRRNGGKAAPQTKPGGGWSRTIVNFWLDCLLLVLFLCLVWVSAVLQFLFPVGAAEGAYWLWGGDVEFWRGVQFFVLCVFALGVLLHVMLHWSWVCGVVTKHLLRRAPSRDDGSQTLIGVGVIVIILHVLGIALLFAWYCVERGPTPS